MFRAAVAAFVALFLFSVFTVVYELRMFANAETLRRQIDSARITPASAKLAFDTLSKKSMFSLPLHWARLSLRDRYVADADRVIADYREASVSTPVTLRDWQRAQVALNSAVALTPEDKSLRGKYDIVDGHLNLKLGKPANLQTARADFDEARKLLPHSPDPHLGLALLALQTANLDVAEKELLEAKRNGFESGARERKQLADGYRQRAEKWLYSARRAHDIGNYQDSLRHAVSDFAHAEDLYNSVAPFQSGAELADRVSSERDRAMKSLAEAQQAQPVASNPSP